jgi:fatty-acyl-CoA synthase
MAAPSYAKGADQPPLNEATLGQAFDEAVRGWPGQDAVVCIEQGVRWTYAELGRRVDAVAGALAGLGLQPGDRIGMWSPNCAEWPVVQFATAKAGLVMVNVNPAYRAEEAAFALDKAGVKALITTTPFKTTDYVGILRALAPESLAAAPGALHAARLPQLRILIHIGGETPAGFLDFEALYELARKPLPQGLSNRDPINIQFTSGTTGQPKGATLSHRNLLNNGALAGLEMGLEAGERMCIPLPLYHCFAMVVGNIACVSRGATMVYPGRGFDPGATLAAVEREGCTALLGVPAMFIAELEHPDFDSFDLSSLRAGLIGGAPCPVELGHRLIERMHLTDAGVGYGMTETSPVSLQCRKDDPLDKRMGSVGRAHPHLEIKLIDEIGTIVPRGARGEICVRGYAVMLGYWDEPEKTAEAIDAEGWMHTGDLATMDEEGFCHIVGRLKDMIIRGGENVYPREIEDLLFTHPKVEEAHIVGVPDARYGEEICAWVRLGAGQSCEAAEIVDFCRERLCHYKTPRYVKFVEAFPMTVTGKVQKFHIREAMIEELGLAPDATA